MPTPSRLARSAGAIALVALAASAIAACSGASTSTFAPASPSVATPGASLAPAASPSAAAPASPSAPASGSASSISIKDFAYSPASLTVAVGATVTWTNDEDALHTITSGTPDARTDMFDSGEIDTGVEFPVTFDEAGTFPFFCDRHEFMRGEITVTP